jgi:hypothetical protein
MDASLQVYYGSDGTRTRDLRRDTPSRAQRRPAKNSSEWPHLQVLFALRPSRLRMVEPIVASTFGPRVGHEMLSGVTTSHTPLWVADAHRAARRSFSLTARDTSRESDAASGAELDPCGLSFARISGKGAEPRLSGFAVKQRWPGRPSETPLGGSPRRGRQPGRMFLLWWKALSGSYLALTSARRRYTRDRQSSRTLKHKT